MGRIGLPELIIILVVVLVIFGAGKLPQVGEAMGKAIRGFKHASKDEEAPGKAKVSAEPAKVDAEPAKAVENKTENK